VVIGGKNKYLINGRTSDQSQVQNLFHSVQLNVNNPHFLIMQGRITKVLNMKPPEILSMIEEAAGTRMFETKKQTALKTIEKKQQKVEEITRVMDDDISPKLSQLRKDKQSFLEWSSNITEVEKLERFCLAAEYKQAAVKVQESENGKTSLENKLEELNKMQEQYAIEAKSCDHEIEVLTNRKHNDMDTALDKLKKSEQELSKELVKINSVCNNQKETLHSENESLLSLSKQIDGANANLNEKQEELVQCNVELERKESQVAAVENNAQVLRTKYQNACAGVTDEDDAQLLSLPEQIGSWEKKAREAQSKLQQETMKIEHSKNRLKELQKALKNEQNTHSRELREAENIRSVLNDITKKAEKLSVSEEEESTLRSTKGSLDLQLQELNDRIENLSAQLEARLNFEFRDPERGFNRARVKGVVAKLVRVPDPVHATALEVAAGGKLFQVVVDNEQTGAMLLKNGDLKKRVTLLPLNKINNKCLDNNKIEKSKRVAHQAGGFANLALELVGYDEEVKRAMQYTFGNAIICSNSAIAQAITFNNEIRCKTVTLEGDSFDPSGTVTGGSRNSIGVLLTKLCELSTMQERYDSLSAELTTIEKQLRKIENNSSELRELRSAQELKLHALAICEEKLANSTYSQMANEISELETEIKRFDEVCYLLLNVF
jgi:structural maintenance of chromosome 2